MDIISESFIPSSVAGFISRLIFHPIDTCKARIQAGVSGSEYKNFRSAFFGTIKVIQNL